MNRPVPRKQYFCEGPSMTKQSEAAACDINLIMKRYEKSGVISHLNRYQGSYEDVSSGISYQEARNQVIRADAAFMSLPAHIRTRFMNDPGKFLEAVSDPSRHAELVELGILPKPAPAAGGTPAVGAGSPAPVPPVAAPVASAG